MDIMLATAITLLLATHFFIYRDLMALKGLAPAIAMNLGDTMARERQSTLLSNKAQFIFFLLILNSVILFIISQSYDIQGTLGLIPFLYLGYVYLALSVLYVSQAKDPTGLRKVLLTKTANIINMVLVIITFLIYLRAFFGI